MLREFGRRATLTLSCRANTGVERGYPHSKRRCRLADASGRRLPSLPGTMPRLVIALALLASVSISIAAYAQQPRVLVFSKTAGFRHSSIPNGIAAIQKLGQEDGFAVDATEDAGDRKSTRLNSSHSQISDAVFCLKKKKGTTERVLCPPSLRVARRRVGGRAP